MPEVKIVGSGFKGAYSAVNRILTASVSKQRLLKCAATVGLQIYGSMGPKPQYAISLAAYKAQAIRCAVTFDQKQLMPPVDYILMDPSEKANISFWIGMAFAALAADECLGIARLLHAASFRRRRQLTMVPGSGRRLADFVGQDRQGKWHSVEAKARQGKVSAKTRRLWKQQAAVISGVDGYQTETRSYAYTRVDMPYCVYLVDPDSSTEETPSSRVKQLEKSIIRAYYGDLVAWLSGDRTRTIRRGSQEVRIALAAYDVQDREYMYLGLTKRTYETLMASKLPKTSEAHDFSDTHIGSDGIAVLTSESSELETERRG